MGRRYTAVEILAWMINYIPHKTMSVITYPWPDNNVYPFTHGFNVIYA